ncbi:MAG: alpha/beta hydrolase [Actinomycetota bacterium]|nr:alpha/beta hydrolase [Actinomycetota bacterium]
MTPLLRSHGSGDPVTLVVPGLGATEGEARIPASGLAGTRVVLTLPGHLDVPDPPVDYWRFPRIAADVRAAAEAIGARQAIGVSLGAAALSTLVATDPTAFDRLVLMLPAALAEPRPPRSVRLVTELGDAVEAGDRVTLRALVAAAVPVIDERTDALLRLGPALREVVRALPVPDPAALHAVTAPVLIIAAESDPMHPAEVAHEAASAFPNATLVVLPGSTPLITERVRLRALLREFLTR